MDQSDNSDNDRKLFPTIEMAEELEENLTRLKLADELLVMEKNCQQFSFENENELNDCSTVQLDNRSSKKSSNKSKKTSVKPQFLNNSLSSPKTSGSPSSSEISKNPEILDSCLDTTLDSTVPTTSEEQQVDNLDKSLETLLNTKPGQPCNLIGIIKENLVDKNSRVFSTFYLVDESMLKVRLQIWNSRDTNKKYAELANLEVGQVVSLQNVNFNKNKFLTISSRFETEYKIDPKIVRTGELRQWFEYGKSGVFETVEKRRQTIEKQRKTK